MSLNQLANTYIPKAQNTKVLKYANGDTDDIIQQVLRTYKKSQGMLNAFAKYLKGSSTLQTCNNIFNFWKNEITYKADPEGVQWAKTPAAVWATKFCDCKSFSIAVATSLNALGIPCRFRFTSYGSNTTMPTHVYVVAMPTGEKEIIIDCVWDKFNAQKRYSKNWDYMAQIFEIAGLDEDTFGIGELNVDVHDIQTTQAEVDLSLSKQQLELEQYLSRKKGIGSVNSATDTAYQLEIEAHNAAIAAIAGKRGKAAKKTARKNKASRKIKKLVSKNNGKGVNKRQAKKLQKAGVTVVKRKETLLKRVGKGIKKIATGPALLALKTQLPKNAPFFLYLFLNPTDNKLFAALPDTVKVKREKALKYKNLIVGKLQMKEANFNTVIRNGIMSAFGKTPEAVLAQWMQEQNFKVGLLPLLAAGSGLKSLLGKAGEAMKADIEQFAPQPEDFSASGLSTDLKEELAKDVESNPSNNDVETGKGKVKPTDTDGTAYDVKNSRSTSPSSYDSQGSQSSENFTNSAGNEVQNKESFENSETGSKVPDSKAGKIIPDPPENKSGMMLILGIGAVGLLVLSKK